MIVDADRGEDLGRVHAVGDAAPKRNGGVPHGCGDAPPDAKGACVWRPTRTSRARRSCAQQDEDARRKAMERVQRQRPRA